MSDQLIALITGANKGIGLQIAKDLAAHGITVLVGSRDAQRGRNAAGSIPGDAHALTLDVTNAESIAAAAARVRAEFGRLDVLINNAGISHTDDSYSTMAAGIAAGRLSVVPMPEARTLYETNVLGVIAVTQAMLPLLRQAPAARIINISSSLGSLTLTASQADPRHHLLGIYSATKAALNAVTVAMAAELESTPIRVHAVCPGFTATDLNNFEGTQTVEEAAREPVRLALLVGADGPTGTYTDVTGPLPW